MLFRQKGTTAVEAKKKMHETINFSKHTRTMNKSTKAAKHENLSTSRQMQNTQPDFDALSFELHDTRAITAPGFLASSDSSSGSWRSTAPPNRTDFSQQDKDEGQIQQQMQELLSIWNSRHTPRITRPESRVSSSASTSIQSEDATILPAPRRYHPSVWKAWTRRVAKTESIKR